MSRPLFDRNIRSRRRIHIDRCGRRTDINRHAITLRHRRHNGSPYLIRRIPVGRNPVTADEYGVYPAVSHDGSRHIIADQGNIHAGRKKLIGRQPRSLQ